MGRISVNIPDELEKKFGLLFEKLRVENTMAIVKKTVKPALVKKELAEDLLKAL
jgi:hypothetical protein